MKCIWRIAIFQNSKFRVVLHKRFTKLGYQICQIIQKIDVFCRKIEKSYLASPKQSKNLRNRKITIFCIEAIPPKDSQLLRKNIFSTSKKKTKKNSEKKVKISKKVENIIISIWKFLMEFSIFLKHFWKISDFFIFFSASKKYFSEELRKFLGYSFDAENCDLSIYEVFRGFGARQIRFLIFWKNTSIFCIIWHISYQIAPNFVNPLLTPQWTA